MGNFFVRCSERWRNWGRRSENHKIAIFSKNKNRSDFSIFLLTIAHLGQCLGKVWGILIFFILHRFGPFLQTATLKLWPVWRDVVSDSRCMTGICDTFKMFSFSVMQSTFRFSNQRPQFHHVSEHLTTKFPKN